MKRWQERGWNLQPSPLQNLFWNQTQCSRRECRKHSIVSMHISTPIVIQHSRKKVTSIYAQQPKYARDHHDDGGHLQGILEGFLEEHLGKLRVGEGERPQTQVGSRVGDSPQHELDGLDELVHKYLAGLLVALLLSGRVSCLHFLDILVRVAPRTQQTRGYLISRYFFISHQGVSLALYGPDFDDRLGQQHERDADKGNQENPQLELVLPAILLPTPHATAPIWLPTCLPHSQADVHHGGDDGRGPLPGWHIADLLVPDLEPLEDDEEVHVAEQEDHEDQLRDKLEPEVKFSLEVDSVVGLCTNTQCHVDDADDDCQFHLEPVDEHQLVLSTPPDGVYSKRIHTPGLGVNWCGDHLSSSLKLGLDWSIARAEQIHAEADEIVVDPPAVEGEEAHQRHHVPQPGKGAELAPAYLLVEEYQEEPQCKEDQPMTDVPEHHPKEERERDCCEDSGVYFLVARDSVSVRDLLCHGGIAVGVKDSGGLGEGGGLEGGGGHQVREFDGEFLDSVGGDVDVGQHELAADFEFVEGFVEVLLLPDELPPLVDAVELADALQEGPQLPLLHLDVVLSLLELRAHRPQVESARVLVVQLRHIQAESLHHSHYLLAQHFRRGVGVDDHNHPLLERVQPLELELVEGSGARVSPRNPVDHLVEAHLGLLIDDTHDVGNPREHLIPVRGIELKVLLTLSAEIGLPEKGLDSLGAGDLLEEALAAEFELIEPLEGLLVSLVLLVDLGLVVVEQFAVVHSQLFGFLPPALTLLFHVALL